MPARVSGGGAALIYDEGVAVPQRPAYDFQGSAVTVTDDAGTGRTVITVAGGGAGGAPTGASYVVGAAHVDLTAELVLGTAVIMSGLDANIGAAALAGRLYIATDTGIVYRDTGAAWVEIARRESATRLAQLAERSHGSLTDLTSGDPHTQYQSESEKAAANGYASLDAGTKVPTAQLGGAGASGTNFLRGDQTWAAPAGGGAAPMIARKTADESVTSSVVLQNDDELAVAVAANKRYLFEALILVNSTSDTPDMALAFVGPAGATGAYAVAALGLGATNAQSNVRTHASSTLGVGLSAGVVSGLSGVQVRGIIHVGGTAGNLTLQWAQDVSNATAVTVRTDSHLIALEIV